MPLRRALCARMMPICYAWGYALCFSLLLLSDILLCHYLRYYWYAIFLPDFTSAIYVLRYSDRCCLRCPLLRYDDVDADLLITLLSFAFFMPRDMPSPYTVFIPHARRYYCPPCLWCLFSILFTPLFSWYCSYDMIFPCRFMMLFFFRRFSPCRYADVYCCLAARCYYAAFDFAAIAAMFSLRHYMPLIISLTPFTLSLFACFRFRWYFHHFLLLIFYYILSATLSWWSLTPYAIVLFDDVATRPVYALIFVFFVDMPHMRHFPPRRFHILFMLILFFFHDYVIIIFRCCRYAFDVAMPADGARYFPPLSSIFLRLLLFVWYWCWCCHAVAFLHAAPAIMPFWYAYLLDTYLLFCPCLMPYVSYLPAFSCYLFTAYDALLPLRCLKRYLCRLILFFAVDIFFLFYATHAILLRHATPHVDMFFMMR